MIDDRFLPRVWTDKGYYYPIFSELGITYENKNLPFTKENIKDINWAFRWRFNHSNENVDMEYINTLEQCTGLKDKNDNLIYDGDILKSKYSDIMKYVVYRGENGFRYKAYGAGNQYCDDGILPSNTSVFEIIGNIHDNSELLDEEKLRIFHGVTRDDIGKICAFYTTKPSEVTYDILADIEGQQYSEEYIGQSGIISRNCRRLNKMESQFECLKQKNG